MTSEEVLPSAFGLASLRRSEHLKVRERRLPAIAVAQIRSDDFEHFGNRAKRHASNQENRASWLRFDHFQIHRLGVRSRHPAVHGETSSSTFPLVSTAKKKQTSAPITATTAQARKTPLKP